MVEHTGGQAFPCSDGMSVEFGMTLRDYFAAEAMRGLMGRAWGDMPGDQLFAIWANSAYAMADAMLAERKK